MRFLLIPISLLYHIVLTIRHKLYDWHILKTTQFDKPVICVGNLNLGGTGKTPHTEYLINLLKDDYHVATLSRGYGRKTKGFRMAEPASTYEDLGDEPLQYYKKHSGIQVAVDKDRVEGAYLLWEQGADVILLDDAFQHRSIKAGLNLLLTEYQHLYCDDFLFPAGNLRDVRSAAKRADIIVVSKSPESLATEEKQTIINKLKPTEKQQVFFSYLEHAPLQPLNEKAKTVTVENTDSVMAFCGIADPEHFKKALERQYKTVVVLPFADHHTYTESDIKVVLKCFESLEGEKKIIVTTEKDAARLTNSPYLCQFDGAPLYKLTPNVRLHNEEKYNEEILRYVRQNYHHY